MPPGPKLRDRESYDFQVEIALIGLSQRDMATQLHSPGFDAALLQILRVLLDSKNIGDAHSILFSDTEVLEALVKRSEAGLPQDITTRLELASLVRKLAEMLLLKTRIKENVRWTREERSRVISALNSWADSLEHAIAAGTKRQASPKSRSKSKPAFQQTAEKSPSRK